MLQDRDLRLLSREELESLYAYRQQLPLEMRLRVESERSARRPYQFVVALGMLVLLIGALFADGMGWIEARRDSAWWSDALIIVVGGIAAFSLYTGRRGVLLWAPYAMVLAAVLFAALVAVVLVF